MNTDEDFTPIDRPLMRSDLHDILRCVHSIETRQVKWYEESKTLPARVASLEKRTWLPALVAATAALVSFVCAVAAAAVR